MPILRILFLIHALWLLCLYHLYKKILFDTLICLSVMEINLQFDNEGRTRCSTGAQDYSTKAVMTTLGGDEIPSKHCAGVHNQSMSTTTISNNLWDSLLQDCEIADSALMPHTFWMPAFSTTEKRHHDDDDDDDRPRCMLECMALQVFQHHVPPLHCSNTAAPTTTTTTTGSRIIIPQQPEDDTTSSSTSLSTTTTSSVVPIMTREEMSKSGAEWWVQIRPSSHDDDTISKTTTATATATTTTTTTETTVEQEETEMSKSGIAFHWDKDEELRHLAGGNLHVHPHISTVTYLTSIGAPTMVCRRRIHALTGEWIVEEEEEDDGREKASSEGYLSWPKRGKHLSFDGGYLHAAPANLVEEGHFEKQYQIPQFVADQNDDDDMQQIRMDRRRRRVTFLVNIWLNHKPINVERFPVGMLDKMSKVGSEDWKLFESPNPLPISTIEVAAQRAATMYTWPMGCDGSNESISALIPVDKVREMAGEDHTICLRWSNDAPMFLTKGETSKRTERDDAESDRKRIRTD